MKFSCEQCGTRYSIADQKVEGKRLRIRCKVCNFIMDVRGTPKHLIRAEASRSETAVQAVPDMAPTADWYVAKDAEPVGPITFNALAAEIKARRIPRDVLVWNENFSDWKSAADVPELSRLLPPPVPVPETATDLADPAEAGSPIADASTQPAKYDDFDSQSDGSVTTAGGGSFSQTDEGGAELDAPGIDTGVSESSSEPDEAIEDSSLSGIEFMPDESEGSVTLRPSDLSETESEAAPIGEKETIDLDGSAQAQRPNFQRDHTEMVSLDELEGIQKSHEEADFSPTGIEEASITELSSESHTSIESDDSIDLGTESVAPAEGTDAQGAFVESEDDIDQGIDHEQGLESASAVADAPVWLGTDDSLPEFDPLAESAQIEEDLAAPAKSSSSADPNVDDEDLVFPNAASVNQPKVEDLPEPTKEASADVETRDTAVANEALRRAAESAAPTLEARQTFVLPNAPVKEKREGSSKTLPAVLIAVVGIVLVSFVVLKNDEQAGPTSVTPPNSSVSQNLQPPETKTAVVPAPKATAKPEAAATVVPTTPAKPTADKQIVAKETPDPKKAKPAEAPLKSEKNQRRAGGLLEQEVTKKPIATPKPVSPKKKAKRQRKTQGLLATSVGSKPDEDKQNVGDGLLAALSADDDEEVDVTKLGSLQGARSTKGKSRGKGRSDRLMKSGNRLETFEPTKMAKTDSTSASLRTNRERLLDLPSEEEDVGSKGDFPAEEVSKIFNRERKGINVCYSRHLKKGGRRFKRQLKLVFTVRPTGAASNVSIGPKYQRTVMRSCLSKFLARIKFPPFDGKAQQVEFNLKLSNIY